MSGEGPAARAADATTHVAADTWRRLRILVGRARARQGAARVRTAFWPIVVASLAAGAAYLIAHSVIGHPYPFFAPTAAWVCLGFAPDRQPRRVLELAIGVALGVGIGDAIVHVIGAGAWQVAVVLLISALIGRFVDKGVLLTTQAGVQGVIIVLLPASSGPTGRLFDALVGGGVALCVAALSPRDPRRRLALLGHEAFNALADTLALLAKALREGRADEARAALTRGRAAEPALEVFAESATNARDLARVNARAMRHVGVIDRAIDQSVLADRTMRSVRVLARRTAALPEGAHDTDAFAQAITKFAVGVRDLASATGEGRDAERARSELADVAATLDPRALAPDDWQVQALVLLARSAVADTLQAAGADAGAAHSALPEL